MLLIIQNGYITPYISRYINEEYKIVKSFETNVCDLAIENYSVIIILGGHQSITEIDNYPYLLNVIKLIKKCIEIKKPLFGICLGCQLVAFAKNCKIVSSGKLNIGYDISVLGYKDLYRCHIDYIVPDKNIEILEYHDGIPYFFKSENIYGMQCHPDIAPECVIKHSGHEPSIEYAFSNGTKINKINTEIMSIILTRLKNGE